MNTKKNITNQSITKRLAVKLNAKGERSVLQGHPWIFSNNIEKCTEQPKTGDVAIVFSKSNNKVIGVGLYDANSPIKIKMLHSGGACTINKDFFQSKIKQAYELRTSLLKTQTNSYRLIFGENDGFPSLIADVYNTVLVVKLYSEIWFPYFDDILHELIEVSKAETVVLRLSRQLQNSKNINLEDGAVIYGDLKNEVVHFTEHGVEFSANVIKGHKTGYFLDHRYNRKQVGELSKGKTVLDVFSYAGGFSVHALANNATAVTSLDISSQALEVAKYNASLNKHNGKHFCIAGDAFTELQQLINARKKFDVVVIDPPSFAKQQSEIDVALKKYKQLAQLGIQLTAKNGILVLASCSSRVVADDFFEINELALQKSKRSFIVENKTYHDVDHPVTFKEGAYLKCGYYRFTD